MSKNNKPTVGSIVWQDLTVKNAEKIQTFYGDVVGWQANLYDVVEDVN